MARMSARSRILGGAFAAVLIVMPDRAHAFEDEWHAGLRGGAASLSHRGWGPAVGLHGAYGISDMFDVSLEGLASWHKDGTDVYSGSIGLVYKIDILEWIPYVGLSGGYYDYAGRIGPNGESGSEIGASVQLGLDYLFSRTWAAIADVRWHASFHDGVNFPLFSATLGAEYRWGF